MSTELSVASLGSLQHRMQQQLQTMFDGVLAPYVVSAIVEELSHVAATWLVDRASDEEFASRGEYALKRAADEAWTTR